MNKPITLIGFMGSGKSTIARHLAQAKGMEYTDLDKLIQESENESIASIFETKGEEVFRQIESNHLMDVIKKPNQIIALGGGTPCYQNNMDSIKKLSTSIYLKVSPEGLRNRLVRSHNPRPLISGMSENELLNYIRIKLSERETYYKQADFVIESDQIRVEDLLSLIFI
jgi:shikimate kinase